MLSRVKSLENFKTFLLTTADNISIVNIKPSNYFILFSLCTEQKELLTSFYILIFILF